MQKNTPYLLFSLLVEGFSLSPGLIIDLSAFNQTIVHAGEGDSKG